MNELLEKEYALNDYYEDAVLTTDKSGDSVMHYSYSLPNGNSIDAYAAEEYTAFAFDANEADSIQIYGDAASDSAE